MADQVPIVPDLASVLRTLAQFSQPQHQPPHDNLSNGLPVPIPSTIDPRLRNRTPVSIAHIEPDAQAQLSGVNRATDKHATTPPLSVPQRRDAPNQAQEARTLIDPATIVDWAPGLRCVNKIAAQNPDFAGAIRKMINHQESHERQWWAGRETLVAKQAGRAEGTKKLNDVLRSIGGHIAEETPLKNNEDHEAELKQYDMKVYKAQCEMNLSMSAELKALGVPFFGVKSELIKLTSAEDEKPSGTSADKSKITEEELATLQSRMLQYLEDMYK